MKLIEDWKRLYLKLWSNKLSLVSALASAVEVAFDLATTGTAKPLVIVAFFVSLGASFARMVAQPSVTGNG